MLGLGRKKDPERLDVYLHGLEGTTKFERSLMEKLAAIFDLVYSMNGRMARMDAAIERLEASVAGMRTVADSAATLIAGIAQQLREIVAGGPTPETIAKINQFSDSLDQEKAELSQAVQENTPATPSEKPKR